MNWTGLVVTLLAAELTAGAAEADFYVAPTGDDGAPGTADRPFATPVRARDAVRAKIAAGLTADVRVLFRAGQYDLPHGLQIGPEDSGTARHSITYAAAPGEIVELVGGTRLDGWRVHKGQVCVADLPEGAAPSQLFENGVRMTLARAPQSGYFQVEKPAGGDEAPAFVYRKEDLVPSAWDISGARVFIWAGHDWFSQEKPVVSIDPATRAITMEGKGGYPIRAGNRYFIRNVLALLDTPGECQIDLKARKVYAWPTQPPIGRQPMVLSTADHVIDVHGEEGRVVRNVHFEGLDIGVANQHAVCFTGAEDCSVRFCKIENAGLSGVMIREHAQRITVYGNLIRENGRHGVELAGLGPGQADVNHHNQVINNHIHHCGRLVGHGYGISITQSGHNQILHNHIHDMPRYGTTIKGVRYQALRKQVKGVTFSNRHSFLHSRNNLIAYNHIHHVNLDSQDTGAMESWGPGRDNVYDHNLIHDVGNDTFDLQSGLYLDDATDYFTVTNNIIYNVRGTRGNQPIFVKGIGNVIDNNILVVGPRNDSAIRSLFMADERCDTHTYTHNLILLDNDRAAIYEFNNWSAGRVASCDFNLFWSPRGTLAIGGACPAKTLDAWRRLDGRNFDAHSVTTDPLFVNAAEHDYRLKDGSPALKLGFKPIDTSAIGLKSDFPKRFDRE